MHIQGINLYQSFYWRFLILCINNIDILNMCVKKCHAKKNFFWLNNFVFLILVFFIDQRGYLISIAYCPFFSFEYVKNTSEIQNMFIKHWNWIRKWIFFVLWRWKPLYNNHYVKFSDKQCRLLLQSDKSLCCLSFCLYEPRHKKTCLRGFQPGVTQTSLLSYRS